ncbi:glycoside hydrolase family 66 protein [Vallitalea okinawensis]|uniref:glycoside hydrolase family 66 protein n=1 Tax=Vallitalea okinawensis TaxID=2078660 RepID=UPI0013003E90|nr:glycoside hydrolase family 66 protein [Vallitalea okinawensis]
MLIRNVVPDKSQYMMGDQVKLTIDLEGADQYNHTIKLEIQIMKWTNLLDVETLHQDIERDRESMKLQYDLEYSEWQIGGYGIDVILYQGYKKVHQYSLSIDFTYESHHSTRIAMVDAINEEVITHFKQLHINYYFLTTYKFFEKSKNKESGINHLLYLPLKDKWEAHYEERRHWSILDKKHQHKDALDEIINSLEHKLTWLKGTFKRYVVSLVEYINGVVLGVEGMNYEDFRSQFDLVKEISKLNKELFIYRDYYWPIKNYDITEQAALILKVRQPYCTYYQLKNIILEGKYFSHYKPVIIDCQIPKLHSIPHEINSYKLLLATIFSNGGYYLLHRIKKDLLEEIRAYFDFQIRYKDVLFEENVSDVTKIYYRLKDNYGCFENFNYSVAALENKVWLIIKEGRGFLSISLINLYNNSNNWTEKKNAIHKLKNLKFNLPIDFRVDTVFLASPDKKLGQPIQLNFEIQKVDKKDVLIFKDDLLNFWDLIVITKKIEVQ